MNRRTVIGMLVAALVAVTTACSSAATHSDADVAFVQGMIPHHTQAVTMSQLAPSRAASPQVLALATEIADAQGPEITQMQGFLASWSVPAAPTGGMAGMGGMTGMMSDQQMQQLQAASGAAFDRLFLQMMIEHHTGAVEMARTELRDGQNADAKELAKKIIDAQQAEITTMTQLLPTV